jgi:hypothetical protein
VRFLSVDQTGECVPIVGKGKAKAIGRRTSRKDPKYMVVCSLFKQDRWIVLDKCSYVTFREEDRIFVIE